MYVGLWLNVVTWRYSGEREFVSIIIYYCYYYYYYYTFEPCRARFWNSSNHWLLHVHGCDWGRVDSEVSWDYRNSVTRPAIVPSVYPTPRRWLVSNCWSPCHVFRHLWLLTRTGERQRRQLPSRTAAPWALKSISNNLTHLKLFKFNQSIAYPIFSSTDATRLVGPSLFTGR